MLYFKYSSLSTTKIKQFNILVKERSNLTRKKKLYMSHQSDFRKFSSLKYEYQIDF